MALATALVRTLPAFRDVLATIAACRYGCANSRIDSTHVAQWLRVAGRHSSAMSKGSTQSSEKAPRSSRSLIFSESHVTQRRLMMKIT